jgi:hypothetical protein
MIFLLLNTQNFFSILQDLYILFMIYNMYSLPKIKIINNFYMSNRGSNRKTAP